MSNVCADCAAGRHVWCVLYARDEIYGKARPLCACPTCWPGKVDKNPESSPEAAMVRPPLKMRPPLSRNGGVLSEMQRIVLAMGSENINRENMRKVSVKEANELGSALSSNNATLVSASLCRLSAIFAVWYDLEVGLNLRNGRNGK